MDVSIIIPTKNAGSSFRGVLDAVFTQKTDLEYEVICVDSGSKDDTVETIKSFPCRLFQIEPEEFGHGKTRNFGAQQGSGEYIVFITQDALPASKTWLQNLVEAMKLDSMVVGGFGIHYVYPDCNILDKRDITAHFASFGEENKVLYIDDQKRYEEDSFYYHMASFFSDNNSCIRRDVWEEYPYPEVDFAEDQIWMRAMLERGYRKVYCPYAPVYHSHNYKLTEFFSRYYDEYQALYTLFGSFLIVERWKQVPRAVGSAIKRDIAYVRSQDMSRSNKLYWIHYCIWREAFKFIGGYLGGKSNLFSPTKKLRYDRRFSQQYSQRVK